MRRYDVVVIGGGVSGTIAAIAAARNGAKTLLIEQYGFLGGALTNMGVGPMMTFHAGAKQVINGIPQEVVDNLIKYGGSPGHVLDTTGFVSTVTPFNAEIMKYVLQKMVIESGAEILYHSFLINVELDGAYIKVIHIANKSGSERVEADVFIDATGDADLAVKCGVDYILGRPEDNLTQPMTMNVRIGNVNITDVKKYMEENPKEFTMVDIEKIKTSKRLMVNGFYSILKEARINGEINFERDMVLFFETDIPGEVIVNMTRVQRLNGTNIYDLTKSEIYGREQAFEVYNFMKKHIPGFQKAYLISTGPQIGVRETRKIIGEYVLTAEDLITSKHFDDCIAIGGYPIDIHSPDGDKTTYMNLGEDNIYEIPFRSLYSKKVNNLLVSGRCISSTHEANAAIRVSPIAMATGQAAGTAAYVAVKNGKKVCDIDIKELRSILLKQKAYIW
ncbi:glucose-inhibited division protein A [Thermoanaerobacterium thermosaccharolyticum DSM 571]|uniref:Glucose-inhibited division protein A n=1 Tax=Thermoanaerobacterium thermosaccharolyticum (strain ATCC 7956 / DSM 571 / NCIMB 9385 / NCA 3814 / NCTC 13789 / WDCM 00135 / 2032) TaxID=580327 RepID=D9TQI1_THETC|nr:FAD-dependent oxidoreductase [Thermoanaerobacterium thermosaccharolyticum]ADL69215.1 glucose-inhibited division protein A [Thermoanaerobacterium thermosaccharolyticum DSM 571]